MHMNDYMHIALAHAASALANDWIPVGAVFVAPDGNVIAHGRKNGETHTRFDHAELNGCFLALPSREGPRDLDGVTVYTTLEPCVLCMSALMTARVSHVVFGLEDPYGGGTFILQSPNLPPRFQKQAPRVISGVLRKESKALLRQFYLSTKGSNHWSDPENPLVKLALG